MRVSNFILSIVVIVVTMSGCSRKADEPTSGHYRGVLELPGGEAPFGIDITKAGDTFVLTLINGEERTSVTDIQVNDGELSATFPGYENSLRAQITRDALKGTVTLIKNGGEQQHIPFTAKLGDTHRFFANALTDNADVSGRWEVQLTNGEGKTSNAVALFKQDHDRVTGTVMTPTGDHRFLDGQVHGDELWLSTFAGGLGYLYKLKVNQRGEIEGEYWQGMKSHETVKAKRNDDAQLVDAESSMKENAALNFTFRDVDGKDVSLSDEQFRGKVVLVTLGGSWCPNCHDESRFLAPFYKENRERGFEAIALMFERHGDFDKAAQAVRRYRRDLGIEFPTLIAGISDTDDASKALPSLSGVYGFPTAIFVDRHGKVRKIHTGFTGPATGHYYDDYVAEFRSFTDELLAESAGSPGL